MARPYYASKPHKPKLRLFRRLIDCLVMTALDVKEGEAKGEGSDADDQAKLLEKLTVGTHREGERGDRGGAVSLPGLPADKRV